MESFRALVLAAEGEAPVLRALTPAELPEGEVLVRVACSSLNYKDGMALAGRRGIVRRYPMVPGIDLAGTVVESADPAYRPGDAVLATGWGLGEGHWGGYAELARLKGAWLVPVPEGLNPERAMALGTAGLTAMLAVMRLQANGAVPGGPPIAVTGATGGVGSAAVALLARLGFHVVASTGRRHLDGYLHELGATDIIDRQTLAEPSPAVLEHERWAGAVDTVGGETLAALLRATVRDGCVAACGLVGGAALATTVYPFILRGVTLSGIDSDFCPPERRRQAWGRLAYEMPLDVLDHMTQTVTLDQVTAKADEILAGRVRGRVVVRL